MEVRRIGTPISHPSAPAPAPAPSPTEPQSARTAPAPRAPWKQRPDEEVMEACLAGDEVAWRELVTRYARLVYSVTRRNGMDPLAAEDVFQEVFFILLRQLPRIRRQSGLPKWLLTTTHRVCRQWYDRTERSAPLPRALLDEAAPPPELAELLERQHLVRLALRRLGGRCQELLTALYAEPGPVRYDEIAHKLDMPEGSIGPTRARCLQKLMAVLVSMERGS